MKMAIKRTVITILAVVTALSGNVVLQVSAAENINIIVADEEDVSEDRVLLDGEVFYITDSGEVIQKSTNESISDNVVLSTASSNTDISGNVYYYYLGKNSSGQPKYQVVLSITSKTNLKSSVLSTKAEGVTSWNNHTASHSGKTGTNTRTYSYTSSNPPSNPYCYAKATITTSDGTTYSIPSKKLTNPKSK